MDSRWWRYSIAALLLVGLLAMLAQATIFQSSKSCIYVWEDQADRHFQQAVDYHDLTDHERELFDEYLENDVTCYGSLQAMVSNYQKLGHNRIVKDGLDHYMMCNYRDQVFPCQDRVSSYR